MKLNLLIWLDGIQNCDVNSCKLKLFTLKTQANNKF